MLGSIEGKVILRGESKDLIEELEESALASIPGSPIRSSRPTSMIIKASSL
ncbi:hypothetical protein Dsin_010683 [Dipteronia sinensis]|uniref:Uncharacterized protein n=1 Tax=Dipteronia sinensis TaxID=43782 RepID=A0AAE0ECT3_9ROSI|nr:hypothetical protein Dsin_010683 [Dipteronia sinensis]